MSLRKAAEILGVIFLMVSSALAAETRNAFTFTKVDLELLEQAELLEQKLERQGLVYHDDALTSYATRVGLSMLPAGMAPERVRWSFHVLRDPMPNAFALPNGSIYVNTGLLSLLENEDQLASVLAHEITHVADRHSYLGYRSYRKKSAVISVAQFAGRMAPVGSWGSVVQLAATLTPMIMTASIEGYARELERNADVYAFNKLIEGGYEPREMPNTFRLLGKKDEVDVMKLYYNDHPKLEDRISYMNKLIEQKAPEPVRPELLAERRMRYQTLTEGVVREDIRLAILSHHSRTALARATKLTEFHPASADNIYCVAEAYRTLGPWTPRVTDEELNAHRVNEIRNLQKKFTPEEEDHALLSHPDGQAAWQANSRLAEENYRKALGINAGHAKTFLGLGELYDQQGKSREALEAYQRYLELSPNAFDQNRVKLRVVALQRAAGQ